VQPRPPSPLLLAVPRLTAALVRADRSGTCASGPPPV